MQGPPRAGAEYDKRPGRGPATTPVMTARRSFGIINKIHLLEETTPIYGTRPEISYLYEA